VSFQFGVSTGTCVINSLYLGTFVIWNTVSRYLCHLDSVYLGTFKTLRYLITGVIVSVLDSGLSGRVRALPGDILLCSWARHFTLTRQSLSLPRSIDGYQQILMLAVALRWTSIQGGVERLLVASCCTNRIISIIIPFT